MSRLALDSVQSRGATAPVGTLSLSVVRRRFEPPRVQTTGEFLRRILRDGVPSMAVHPNSLLRRYVNRYRLANMPRLAWSVKRALLARALGIPTFYGALELTPIFRIGTPQELRLPLGLVGCKVVTTTGVNFLVDALQGIVEPEILKYHALGTGSVAEDASDTALGTELTTEYTGNVRATGNLAEGASANIFHTEATNTLDATPGAALREHGILSQAATGGGILLDRTVYTAITLSAGDGLLSKYELTLAAGS